MEDIGITNVVYIKHSRFFCFFEDSVSDVNKFFEEAIVEFRLTLGSDFNKTIF
jgi:hypothetical protein